MPADGYAPERRVGRPATAGEIERLIRLYSQSLDYTVDVPGTHYSGLTNQQLFDILASQDRDFAKNNKALRTYVATELRIHLEGTRRLPTNEEIDALAARAVLARVMSRLHGKVRDITVRRLTEAYAKAKFKAGFKTPIGVRTGALYYAVSKAAVVIE
jgi:hypothetical protein